LEPPDKDEEGAFDFTGASLDAEGNLEGQPQASVHTRLTRPPPRRPAAPLELEARQPPKDSDYVPPPPLPPVRPPSQGLPVWPFGLLLLAALGVAGWWWYGLQHKEKRAPIAVVILVTSEPAGAVVSVEGSPMGVTPWAADNTWGPGPVQVDVSLPGYRTWSGTFPGGRPARLSAKLQKR
jgi:eukaryotic-like serine/threonine-protein kinase